MTLLVFRFRNTAFHRRPITTRSRHLSTRTGNNNNTNLNHAVAAQSSTSHHRRQSTVAPQLEAIGSTTSLTDLIRQFIEKKDEHSSLYRTDRPQKPLERIRNFPEGVKGIVRDCLRYKAIQDTPVSAWIIEYPTTAAFGSGDKGRIQSDNVGNTDPRNRTIQKYLGRIPRRQYEQQLQLQNDMRAMFPLVRIPSLERTVFPVAKLRHLTLETKSMLSFFKSYSYGFLPLWVSFLLYWPFWLPDKWCRAIFTMPTKSKPLLVWSTSNDGRCTQICRTCFGLLFPVLAVTSKMPWPSVSSSRRIIMATRLGHF